MKKLVKHPTYKAGSFVTVQDIYDAMQYKQSKPANSREDPKLVSEIDKKDGDRPNMTRVISYFDNKFRDIDRESPEFSKVIE